MALNFLTKGRYTKDVSTAAELCAVGRHHWLTVLPANPEPVWVDAGIGPVEVFLFVIYCPWCEALQHLQWPLPPDVPPVV